MSCCVPTAETVELSQQGGIETASLAGCHVTVIGGKHTGAIALQLVVNGLQCRILSARIGASDDARGLAGGSAEAAHIGNNIHASGSEIS